MVLVTISFGPKVLGDRSRATLTRTARTRGALAISKG